MSCLHEDLLRPRRSMGYLSAPISAPEALFRTYNRLRAQEVSARLWEAAVLHYCPHANSPAVGCTDVPYETWMAMDLEVIQRCDWVLMLEGWEQSVGCTREFNVALNLDIPVVFTVEEAVERSRQLDQQWAEEAEQRRA